MASESGHLQNIKDSTKIKDPSDEDRMLVKTTWAAVSILASALATVGLAAIVGRFSKHRGAETPFRFYSLDGVALIRQDDASSFSTWYVDKWIPFTDSTEVLFRGAILDHEEAASLLHAIVTHFDGEDLSSERVEILLRSPRLEPSTTTMCAV